jgi:hypothetical protein
MCSTGALAIKPNKQKMKGERSSIMKQCLKLIVVCIFVAAYCITASAGEKAPQKVVDLAHSKLADVGKDPIIIDAVKAENAKGKSLAQIKAMDAKWKGTPGFADYMKAMMTSECGQRIAAIQKSAPYYAEIFVMDNQGANVAMTNKTSDYWQGDEAKFAKSFNGGHGAIFIDDVEFDESSQAYLVQVSVPVVDAGTVIGAITFGIDVDQI